MRLSPHEILRFAVMMNLAYIEGGVQGGESVLWFRTQKGERVSYRPEDIRRTLKERSK